MGCCFCCCGTKRRVCCCLSTLTAIIIAVIILCVFLIPRKPTVCFTVGYPEDFSASASGISIMIPVNVSVANHNHFGITLNDVIANLNYNERSLLTGTTMTNLAQFDAPGILIPARANSTNQVLLTFDANSRTSQADADIIEDCTPSGTTDLYINATIYVMEHLAFTIPNQQISVNCSIVPSVSGTAAALVQNVNSSTSTASSYYCS